jgi:hypothetical protein
MHRREAEGARVTPVESKAWKEGVPGVFASDHQVQREAFACIALPTFEALSRPRLALMN